MKRYIALGLTALFVSGTVYAAQNDNSYDMWDADGDGQLTEQEFNTGFENNGLYDDWDANGDGSLSEDEFGSGLYDSWDANDDGWLSDDEWDSGFWDI